MVLDLKRGRVRLFVKKNAGVVRSEKRRNRELGDPQAFVALHADTKLVPSFLVGRCQRYKACQFTRQRKDRISGNGKRQLTTNAFHRCLLAADVTSGSHTDFARVVKVLAAENPGSGPYVPPRASELIPTE
jgi:hypothetical protein